MQELRFKKSVLIATFRAVSMKELSEFLVAEVTILNHNNVVASMTIMKTNKTRLLSFSALFLKSRSGFNFCRNGVFWGVIGNITNIRVKIMAHPTGIRMQIVYTVEKIHVNKFNVKGSAVGSTGKAWFSRSEAIILP